MSLLRPEDKELHRSDGSHRELCPDPKVTHEDWAQRMQAHRDAHRANPGAGSMVAHRDDHRPAAGYPNRAGWIGGRRPSRCVGAEAVGAAAPMGRTRDTTVPEATRPGRRHFLSGGKAAAPPPQGVTCVCAATGGAAPAEFPGGPSPRAPGGRRQEVTDASLPFDPDDPPQHAPAGANEAVWDVAYQVHQTHRPRCVCCGQPWPCERARLAAGQLRYACRLGSTGLADDAPPARQPEPGL